MNLSPQGRAFLTDYEKARSKAYRDSAGKWTIGIGHLLTPREIKSDLMVIGEASITWRTTTLTPALMDTLFVQDLAPRESALNKLLTKEPTQQQFDAMLCLLYNIGQGSAKLWEPGGFTRSSVRRNFNKGNTQKTADAFLLWNKARNPDTGVLEVSPGLVKRRAQERAMFLDGNYNSEH